MKTRVVIAYIAATPDRLGTFENIHPQSCNTEIYQYETIVNNTTEDGNLISLLLGVRCRVGAMCYDHNETDTLKTFSY